LVGDASNPRIDVVCIKANDPTQGDDDNQVVALVVQGTPAVSPVVPAIPAGAVAVATMRMPAGATATNAAIVMAQPDYAIPFGGSLGVLADSVYPQEDNYAEPLIAASAQIYVPTRRLVEMGVTLTCGSTEIDRGSIYARINLDGNAIRTFEHAIFLNSATSGFFTEIIEIEQGAHTIALVLIPGAGGIFHTYGTGDINSWAGQRLVISDRGVA